MARFVQKDRSARMGNAKILVKELDVKRVKNV
jgi:hypothetical protein